MRAIKTKRGQLGLEIPIIEPNKKIHDSINSANISAWRSSLSIADTGATAKKLFSALNDLDLTPMTFDKRLATLEILRPVVQLICQELKKHYINPPNGLTQEKLTIANIAQTLQFELALGYKLVIEDLISESLADKSNLLLAFLRVIKYLGSILLRSYQLYARHPENVWQELNTIYEYCKQHNLAKAIIPSTNAEETIENVYKQVLIMAVINPAQWRQSELETISAAIPEWSKYVSIKNLTEVNLSAPGLYIIDTKHDDPPSPVGLEEIVPNSNCLILDMSGVIERLTNIYNEMRTNELAVRMKNIDNNEYKLTTANLSLLIKEWSTPTKRQHQRVLSKERLDFAFGVSSVHYYLSHEQPFTLQQTQAQKKTTDDTYETSSLPTVDITAPPLNIAGEQQQANFTLAPPATSAASVAPTAPIIPTAEQNINIELSSIEETPKAKQPEFQYFTCNIHNIHQYGACLLWETELLPLIQPGELICCRINNQTTNWHIGAIRWMKRNKENKIKIGITFLSSSALSAGIQALKNNAPSSYFLRSFYLPKDNNLHVNHRLLTPTIPFKVGAKVKVHLIDTNQAFTADLTQQVESTNSFRVFEYTSQDQIAIDITPTEPPAETPKELELPKVDEPNGSHDEFGSVWDNL